MQKIQKYKNTRLNNNKPFVYVADYKNGAFMRVNATAMSLITFSNRVDLLFDENKVKLIFCKVGEYSAFFAKGGALISADALIHKLRIAPGKRYECHVNPQENSVCFEYECQEALC